MNEIETNVYRQIGISDTNIAGQIQADFEIRIVMENPSAGCYLKQVTAETVVNLLSRIFPNIVLEVAESPCLLPDPLAALIKAHLEEVRCKARRWEKTHPAQKSLRIVIGETGTGDVFVAGSGWWAGVGITPVAGIPSVNLDLNPLGAVMAGILGATEIFKRTLGLLLPGTPCVPVQRNYIFSLLDYQCYIGSLPPDNPEISGFSLENPVLFGVGSVGSAVLLTLSYWRELSGSITLVDNDAAFNWRNLLRYSFLTESDLAVFSKTPKVYWAEAKLKQRSPNLIVYPFNQTVNDWLNDQQVNYRIPLALSAVDTAFARLEIAEVLAKRTLNAATGAMLAEVTRHGFGRDGMACLACLYEDQYVKSKSINVYVEKTGLSTARVNQLINRMDRLTIEDLNVIAARGLVAQADIPHWVGESLRSLMRERTYASAVINTGQGETQVVTLAFVSHMTGTLLAAELVKETLGWTDIWKGNRFYVDARFLPDMGTHTEKPGARDRNGSIVKGRCLCEHSFRQEIYRRKYGV
ncbi:MAG: ThiF family adenylyltransferase [Bacillota bacterium]